MDKETYRKRHCLNGRKIGDKLENAILAMELTSVSRDAETRTAISELPPEVSEESSLSTLHNKESVEKFAQEVDEALILVKDYNCKLDVEDANRRKVKALLRDYKSYQKQSLSYAKKALAYYSHKIKKMQAVREKLKLRKDNFINLIALFGSPDDLEPLPTAAELFRSDA